MTGDPAASGDAPPQARTPRRRRWRELSVDLTPLRVSRDYRFLTASSVISGFGSFLTYVAVPFQIKELTGSALAVGLLGATELVPLVVCGLWGGALADAMDRRKMVVATEAAAALLAVLLLVNALLPHPALWPIYALTAAFAAANGLQRPSQEAIVPRIVPPDLVVPAGALQWMLGSFTQIAGPAVGGVLVATTGPTVSYLVDAATFVISVGFLLRLKPSPQGEDAEEASLRGIAAGWRYARSRQELIGTYVVDIAAMAFAMPTALFPFLADHLHASWSLGLLYAAPAVGSALVSLTSGWTKHVHRHGMAVIWAAGAWGVAIALVAATQQVWIVLACLAAAGAADAVSGVFRMSIWNQTIPDALRGRLAGIEMLSFSTGPILGQVRAGSMAALRGPVFSVGFGGVACVGAVVGLAAWLPGFRRYDARTDTHAVAVRAERLAAHAEPSL
ncbi:MFS family permease [Catenulispora sp. EB89]|uniref:MFS transporter n=1 Tax=Catenulispora sp. EB89 TaxID=3156257 RepID=UPI0035193C4D